MEPQGLTLKRLEKITNGFSEDRKIGQGSFGTVYKGVLENGEAIAVKKLHEFSPQHNDMHFHNEFGNLQILKHQNIVRFVAYCCETKPEPIEYNGTFIIAERRHRALCFEYMHNGSLRKHLTDGLHGPDWHARYKIIKGTCEGLKYLHEGLKEPIYHLDLKPDNILLDESMVPKLADFGLSKIFDAELTRRTGSAYGTPGYQPPEYIERGIVSKEFDIFSLGVVIIKIIAGYLGYEKCHDMSPQEFIDSVERNWRLELQSTYSGSLLQAYCQQVKRCTEIALSCLERERKKRPSIVDIIRMLNEAEHFVESEVASEGNLWMFDLNDYGFVDAAEYEECRRMIAVLEAGLASTSSEPVGYGGRGGRTRRPRRRPHRAHAAPLNRTRLIWRAKNEESHDGEAV